jgi:ATP-dependent DNA helicase RecG
MTMTHTELLEMIRNGENSGVEFKRDDIQNHDLAKELVAFSNLAGGVMLLGVEDDGSISGITRPKLEEWVMTACRDKIRPAIIPFYSVVKDVEPGKDVAIVRVAQGSDVHAMWHNGRNFYYIRVGSQSRESATEELGRLFQQRGALRAELTPVSGAKFSDLDIRRLKDYFIRIRQQLDIVPADDDEAGWKTLLINTEFMGDDGINVAALLLFGRQPQRFLPQASINAAAYPGTEKDYAARERIPLKGALTALFSANGADRLQIVETGLIEQAIEFVARNTGVTARLVDGTRREDIPTYPTDVIREAIVNAVIHRDYRLSGTDIELSIYEDRIEIISPGRLHNGITPERMRTGCRASRNQLIRDTMSDYKYMDNSGLGIPRKIIPLMKRHNGTDPLLVENDERFTVTLFRGDPGQPQPATPFFKGDRVKHSIFGIGTVIADPQASYGSSDDYRSVVSKGWSVSVAFDAKNGEEKKIADSHLVLVERP